MGIRLSSSWAASGDPVPVPPQRGITTGSTAGPPAPLRLHRLTVTVPGWESGAIDEGRHLQKYSWGCHPGGVMCAGDAVLLHACVPCSSEVCQVPACAAATHHSPCSPHGGEHPPSPTPLAPVWGAAGLGEKGYLGMRDQPDVVFCSMPATKTSKNLCTVPTAPWCPQDLSPPSGGAMRGLCLVASRQGPGWG